MRAVKYWSNYSGYWELFKDRKVFTALWEGMLNLCEEYNNRRNSVLPDGILDIPDRVTVKWQPITADDGDPVRLLDDNGEEMDETVTSIPVIWSEVEGTKYVEGTDYEIDYDTGVITWVDDPSQLSYMAEECTIKTDIIDKYYNLGLFDLDLSVYDDPRWVLYACIRTLEYPPTELRLKNIVSILAGVPFSKYYAEITYDEGDCLINYAVVVETDHELFLRRNHLIGYVFIDFAGENIYDGYYPDVPLMLCHKHNLLYTGTRYQHKIKSERVEWIGVQGAASGELMACGHVVETTGASWEMNYESNEVSAIYDSPAGEGYIGTVIGYDPTMIGAADIGSHIMVRYTDTILIGEANIQHGNGNALIVKDTAQYVFRVGDRIVLVDDLGNKTPHYIREGYYNYADNTYVMSMSGTLNKETQYSMAIPIIRESLCPASILPHNTIAVPINIGEDAIISFHNAPNILAVNDTTTLTDDIYSKGDEVINLFSDIGVEVGDTISITAGGDQDYYTVIDGESPEYEISPPLVRDYPGLSPVCNLHRYPLINKMIIKFA